MKGENNWKLWMDTTLHEMIHAFGLNSDFFPEFLRNSNGI